MKILVTGGAGFIGSAYVRHLITATEARVLNFDALTYAGNLASLESVSSSDRYQFLRGDIRDSKRLSDVMTSFQPDAIVHLAAESHVDNSIDGPLPFVETNVLGTFQLLHAALGYYRTLSAKQAESFRFHHVSTDEVYGDLGPQDVPFSETTPYSPSSPYSATKASSDHLVRAWGRTYGLPILLTNCSNNYGPYQFPEKLIPHMILCALAGKPLPVYGDGRQIRDWLYVEDHARALWLVLQRGAPGSTYNIGGCNEVTNLEVVKALCALLSELKDPSQNYETLIEFVTDRPGHDRRYAIDCSKIREELNWQPQEEL